MYKKYKNKNEWAVYFDIIERAGRCVLQTQVIDGECDPTASRHNDLPATHPGVRVQVGVVGRRNSSRGSVQLSPAGCGERKDRGLQSHFKAIYSSNNVEPPRDGGRKVNFSDGGKKEQNSMTVPSTLASNDRLNPAKFPLTSLTKRT